MDRVAITTACRTLARRSRTRGGVYAVLNGPSREQASIRGVLRGDWTVLYLGCSSSLLTRALHLASGFLGTNYRHRFFKFHLNEMRGEPAPEHLAIMLMPFGSPSCLEGFALNLHQDIFGDYPIGNSRRATRSSAHHQEPPVDVTPDLLLNRAPRV